MKTKKYSLLRLLALTLTTATSSVSAADINDLIQAAQEGNVAAIRQLVTQSINVNEKISQGYTPLHFAVSGSHVEAIKVLHELGANLEGATNNGVTPLFWAARKGNVEVIRVLHELGANLEAVTHSRTTSLYRAAYNEQVDTIQVLHGLGDVEAPPQNGVTPLFWAAHYGQIGAIRVLHELGANLNAAGDGGDTPLHRAAQFGFAFPLEIAIVEVIKVLHELGANLEATDDRGNTPLHIAAKGKNVEVLKVLLEAGANVKAQDRNGLTALDLAIRNPNTQVFEYLAQNYQSLLHTPDNAGETVAHKAVREKGKNAPILIELCNKYQLDFTARNQAGQTPLEIAQAANQPAEVINIIQKAMQYNNVQQPTASATPPPSAPKLWSACQIGQAYQQELNTVQHQTNRNQTTQAITTDDDDESGWYFFDGLPQQSRLDDQNDHPQDDADNPDARFLLTSYLDSI